MRGTAKGLALAAFSREVVDMNGTWFAQKAAEKESRIAASSARKAHEGRAKLGTIAPLDGAAERCRQPGRIFGA